MPTFMEVVEFVRLGVESSPKGKSRRPESGATAWVWTDSGTALRELEALAGAGLAGLLAFLLARVAADVAGLLQGGTELGVHLLEGAGDPVRHRPGLAGDAAAGHVGRHVDLLAQVHRQERGVGLLGKVVVGEITVERASVDDQLAAAVGDPHAGGPRLAASGPLEDVGGRGARGGGNREILTGLLASCGCFVPAKTRSLVSIRAARRFLGSIPLTACM